LVNDLPQLQTETLKDAKEKAEEPTW